MDTSVVGGCQDKEFEEDSLALMEMAQRGEARLLISRILADELKLAPDKAQKVLSALPEECLESVDLSEEARQLRDAYLAAGVVGKNQSADAYHVALATVARADVIVSWNFKHIVHFDKIRGFNAVNLQEGYLPIDIRSPKEVA